MTLPKRVEIETSWTTPDTPMKTDQEGSEHQPDRHRPDGEAEESRAGRRQQARRRRESGRGRPGHSVRCWPSVRAPAAHVPSRPRTPSPRRACVRRRRARATGRCSRRRGAARLERNERACGRPLAASLRGRIHLRSDRLDARGCPHGVVEDDLTVAGGEASTDPSAGTVRSSVA